MGRAEPNPETTRLKGHAHSHQPHCLPRPSWHRGSKTWGGHWGCSLSLPTELGIQGELKVVSTSMQEKPACGTVSWESAGGSAPTQAIPPMSGLTDECRWQKAGENARDIWTPPCDGSEHSRTQTHTRNPHEVCRKDPWWMDTAAWVAGMGPASSRSMDGSQKHYVG